MWSIVDVRRSIFTFRFSMLRFSIFVDARCLLFDVQLSRFDFRGFDFSIVLMSSPFRSRPVQSRQHPTST